MTQQKSFNHDELLQALYYIDDILSRAFIPYFLIKDTAHAVENGQNLSGIGIHVGVRSTDWESSGLSILEVIADAVNTNDKLVEYEYNGVPIYVNIFNKNHPCIQSTNAIPYAMEYFNIPNPYNQFEQIYL